MLCPLDNIAEPRHSGRIDTGRKPETSERKEPGTRAPTYRQLLTIPEHENRMMLICISRAAEGSHLTLDL